MNNGIGIMIVENLGYGNIEAPRQVMRVLSDESQILARTQLLAFAGILHANNMEQILRIVTIESYNRALIQDIHLVLNIPIVELELITRWHLVSGSMFHDIQVWTLEPIGTNLTGADFRSLAEMRLDQIRDGFPDTFEGREEYPENTRHSLPDFNNENIDPNRNNGNSLALVPR